MIPCPKLKEIPFSRVNCLKRNIGRESCQVECRMNYKLSIKGKGQLESVQFECINGIWVSKYDVSCQGKEKRN